MSKANSLSAKCMKNGRERKTTTTQEKIRHDIALTGNSDQADPCLPSNCFFETWVKREFSFSSHSLFFFSPILSLLFYFLFH